MGWASSCIMGKGLSNANAGISFLLYSNSLVISDNILLSKLKQFSLGL